MKSGTCVDFLLRCMHGESAHWHPNAPGSRLITHWRSTKLIRNTYWNGKHDIRLEKHALMCYVLFVNESMSLQIRKSNLYQKARNTFFNSGRHHLWQIVALGCFIRIPRTFTQVRAFCGGDSPRSEAAESAGELELRLEDLRLRWTARARLCLQWEDSERGFYLQCLARTHARTRAREAQWLHMTTKKTLLCLWDCFFSSRGVSSKRKQGSSAADF